MHTVWARGPGTMYTVVRPVRRRSFGDGVGRFSVGSRFPQFKFLNAKRGGPTENAFRIDLVTNYLSVGTEKIVASYRNATLAM